MPTTCGAWSAVTTLEDGSILAHPLRCRSWNCPTCRTLNKRRLHARLPFTTPHSFLTLTCNPSAHPDPTTAFRSMSSAVNTLFKRIRRRYPSAVVEYFLIWERTKNGWPHAHLLLNAPYIPQPWLSSTWHELTGAPIVDIRAIHDATHLVSYLAKYLAKDPQAPPGMKRYRHSRGFFPAATTTSYDSFGVRPTWRLSPYSTRDLARLHSSRGFTCVLHPDETLSAYPPGLSPPGLTDSYALTPDAA